jgi:hypothetical protein
MVRLRDICGVGGYLIEGVGFNWLRCLGYFNYGLGLIGGGLSLPLKHARLFAERLNLITDDDFDKMID